MNKLEQLEPFLIKARANTYASDEGRVKAALNNSTQLEYKESDWLYRDVYYTGKNTFYGMETVFYLNKPIFGVSYYGNWGDMTEEEIDNILRGALINNKETRLYKKVEWEKDGFIYTCDPASTDGINEIGGTEQITKDDKHVYVFYYAGSVLV